MRRLLPVAALAGAWALAAGPARAAITVEPNPIRVTAFYDGTTVRVTGRTLAGSRVVVTIAAEPVTEAYNRKGRIGPLWANVGKVTLKGAPGLFLVADGGPAVVLDPAEAGRHLLDVDAVARQIQVEPARDVELMQREYVALKRSSGAYVHVRDAVAVAAGSGEVPFTATLPWPDRAPAGEYVVRVYHLHDGRVVHGEADEARLRVELAGLPAWMYRTAFHRSALYGVLSVLIAVAVGFVMGLVFKRKGGGGH